MSSNMWDAQFIVDIEMARRVCINECDIGIKSITAFGEGWDNTAYLINEELVFRFPRREIAVSCMLAEIALLPIVKTSIEIPELKYFNMKSKITGKPFVGYKRIKGSPVGTLELNETEISNLVRPIAKFLKELHTTCVPKNIAEKWEKNQEWRTDIKGRIQLAEKMFKKSSEMGIDFNYDFEEVKNKLENVHYPKFKTLVHGDFYPLHILIDYPNQLSGIIDWGDSHFGSPCQDLSIAFGFFPKEVLSDFEDEYGPLPDEWKIASAFRAFCHSLSLLPFTIEKEMVVLKKQMINSNIRSKEWIDELVKD